MQRRGSRERDPVKLNERFIDQRSTLACRDDDCVFSLHNFHPRNSLKRPIFVPRSQFLRSSKGVALQLWKAFLPQTLNRPPGKGWLRWKQGKNRKSYPSCWPGLDISEVLPVSWSYALFPSWLSCHLSWVKVVISGQNYGIESKVWSCFKAVELGKIYPAIVFVYVKNYQQAIINQWLYMLYMINVAKKDDHCQLICWCDFMIMQDPLGWHSLKRASVQFWRKIGWNFDENELFPTHPRIKLLQITSLCTM